MRFPIVTVMYIIIIVLATLLVGCRKAEGGEKAATAAVGWIMSEDGMWLVAGDPAEEGEGKAKQNEGNADEHLMFGESLGELAVGI